MGANTSSRNIERNQTEASKKLEAMRKIRIQNLRQIQRPKQMPIWEDEGELKLAELKSLKIGICLLEKGIAKQKIEEVMNSPEYISNIMEQVFHVSLNSNILQKNQRIQNPEEIYLVLNNLGDTNIKSDLLLSIGDIKSILNERLKITHKVYIYIYILNIV